MPVEYHVVDAQRDFATDNWRVVFSDDKGLILTREWLIDNNIRKRMAPSGAKKQAVMIAAMNQRMNLDAHDRIVKFGSAWLGMYDAEMLRHRCGA